MEKHDIELIEKYVGSDKLLSLLYSEHIDLERQLEKLNSKPYLTPNEEAEKKRIQKVKLIGRDKMEGILRRYRDEMHG